MDTQKILIHYFEMCIIGFFFLQEDKTACFREICLEEGELISFHKEKKYDNVLFFFIVKNLE